MAHSRRDFIRYIVAGSVASGCPINESLHAPPDLQPESPVVHGDHFEICHQLRDGREFRHPDATQKADIVVIGGGAAGLSAAYFLRGQDWLLLEKEDHFGGNAYQEEYEGDAFATGSAYAYRGDYGDQLAAEIGLRLPLVDNPDPTIVNGAFVADTWKSGLGHLPYSKEVVASFKKFRDAAAKIRVAERMAELDAQPFTNFTSGFAPEVAQWWDGYGASNWGAMTQDTSAYVGLGAAQDLITGDDAKRAVLTGGLGCITHRLVELLRPHNADSMVGGATVVAVVQDRKAVRITYLREDKLITVQARAALFCAPKQIASRVVFGMPPEQRAAMRQIRYAPYPVVNVIFDKPVYNRGYDTWCPGNTFTDFIVADWTIRNRPGYQQKHNILSFYTPLREQQRSTLLDEADCRALAARVLADFQKLLPEFDADPIEVRIYRRGHAMFMATPRLFTGTRIAAARPMDRIFFGHSDSGGPESLTSEAVRLSKVGVEWARLVLTGKSGARALAEKALAASAA